MEETNTPSCFFSIIEARREKEKEKEKEKRESSLLPVWMTNIFTSRISSRVAYGVKIAQVEVFPNQVLKLIPMNGLPNRLSKNRPHDQCR